MNLNIIKMNKRTHCISSRLNADELDRLDQVRGRIRRGTYMRLLFNDSLPAPVPEVNRQAYAQLARSASNLNQIAHRLNMSQHIEMQEALDALRDFRARLLEARD